MKIDVVNRDFLKRMSKNEWLEMLAGTRVISIRSSDGWDDSFPVPKGVRPHDNLLCTAFDDSTGIDDWDGRELPILFDAGHAEKIVQLVRDDSMPLVVQCTAGISRSGAIGVALDEFFNLRGNRNLADHEYFVAKNPQVRPNALVLRLMREALAKTLSETRSPTSCK